jgi:hypothetical protein
LGHTRLQRFAGGVVISASRKRKLHLEKRGSRLDVLRAQSRIPPANKRRTTSFCRSYCLDVYSVHLGTKTFSVGHSATRSLITRTLYQTADSVQLMDPVRVYHVLPMRTHCRESSCCCCSPAQQQQQPIPCSSFRQDPSQPNRLKSRRMHGGDVGQTSVSIKL